MKRIFPITICFLALFLVRGSSFGLMSGPAGPKDLAKTADLVVVGKLSDIVEREFTFTFNKPRWEGASPFTAHYDVGIIKNPKILKGKVHWWHTGGSVRIAFVSKGQDKLPGMLGGTHSLGEEGVWFLTLDRSVTGNYFEIQPRSPWPLSCEAEVLESIKESENK